jgi:hypothetical protein
VDDFRIFLWNNSPEKSSSDRYRARDERIECIDAAVYEKLAHIHAVPLQRLYELSRNYGPDIVITLDSDAHPLRSSWMAELIDALDKGAALAGVWRDEVSSCIEPYIHPSCLATTVSFIERFGLRFDRIPSGATDTLSHFSNMALDAGLPTHALIRSNARNYHVLMGGIYGDMIYHHGAGSRKNIRFRGDVKGARYDRVRDISARMVFREYDSYIGWLRGDPVAPDSMRSMLRLKKFAKSEGNGADSARLFTAPLHALRPTISRVLAKAWRKMLSIQRSMTRTSRYAANMTGPLSSKNMHARPSGWNTVGPHFVGVGAPKCGTTWWYSLLLGHPQIVPNRAKDGNGKELQHLLHFTDRSMDASELDEYRGVFAAPPGAICGEFSTRYLSAVNGLENLAAASPETKVLLILRNPIDRTWSHINHLIERRRKWIHPHEPKLWELFIKYSIQNEALLYSFYSDALKRLYGLFDKDSVLVLQYERCVASPGQEFAATCRFLGIDDQRPPSNPEIIVGSSRKNPRQAGDEARRIMADYFYEDTMRTLELCPSLDPALWPDFHTA